MTMTNAEQYLLELINRARLDPAAEAARYGMGLNDGPPPVTIDATAKQVLSPNSRLEQAAVAHTMWMLNTDTFSHTGVNNTQPFQRAATYGYNGFVGENIAFNSLGSGQTLASMIDVQHRGFMGSPGHRALMMNDRFSEVGLGQEQGSFTGSNGSMVTEVYGNTSANKNFLTGVAYSDRDGNGFYSIGEGVAGVAFAIGQVGGRTTSTGGYGFGITPDATAAVTGVVGQVRFTLTVDMGDLGPGNVKLDVVNGSTFLTSGNITLGTGIHNVRLLGVDPLDARGSSAANTMIGNRAGNDLHGASGNDRLYGVAGNDRMFGDAGGDLLYGGDGNDRMFGGDGNDVVWAGDGNDAMVGGLGSDTLSGDLGNDSLNGASDNDALYGRAGADTFFFTNNSGSDVIYDFALREGDKLMLDAKLWGGGLTEASVVARMSKVINGQVVFNFGDGDVLRLASVTTQSGLAAVIDII